MVKPRVGITVGDPAGIGPEIALKAAADPRVLEVCEPRLYGPDTAEAIDAFPRGRVSAEAGRAAYEAIVRAVGDAREGRSTPSPPPRSTRKRSRWRACSGRGT